MIKEMKRLLEKLENFKSLIVKHKEESKKRLEKFLIPNIMNFMLLHAITPGVDKEDITKVIRLGERGNGTSQPPGPVLVQLASQ